MCRPQVHRRRLLYLVVGRRRVDISPIIRLALLYLSYYYDYCHTTGALICTTLFSDSFGLFKNPRCIITVTVKEHQKKNSPIQIKFLFQLTSEYKPFGHRSAGAKLNFKKC